LLAAGAASAGGCPAHYVDGRLPEIRNPKLASATRELCYGVFGVVHSGVTRTPLWSAEHLQAENLASAQDLPRKSAFHAEAKLPPSQRAELSDYARSGFDRGHMAPSADMPDRDAQRESFTLANMVPQDAENNRHVWAGIEGAVRKMAKQEGALYVITGPAFIGATVQKVGKVLDARTLLSSVHEHDYDDREAQNLVKVHIANLRRKLEDGRDGNPYILCVRGFGYMLERRAERRENDPLTELLEAAGQHGG
jgi:endonuclease G